MISAVAIGANTNNKILQRRSNALARARLALTDKLQSNGIISTDMLQNELRRIFHDELLKWDRKRYLSAPFFAMKAAMVHAKTGKTKAYDHMRRASLFKVFSTWRDYCSQERRRIPRFNQLQVDLFSTTRLLKVAFNRWHRLARLYTEAARKHRIVLTRFAREHFVSWRFQASHYRKLKARALTNWMQYGETVMTSPFHNWQEWAINKRNSRCVRERFLHAHRRIKERKLLSRVFRHWNHQMLYGRVSALYTRHELMEMLAAKTKKLEEMETQIEAYKAQQLQQK